MLRSATPQPHTPTRTATLLAATAHAQVAESTVPLSGQTPLRVLNGDVARVSHYNPEQKLHLALAIQPPHMAEEEQFIRELTTKGSPGFHKFLSPEEWDVRFGPSVEDEQKVVDWANSVGLTVTHRYPDRLLVDVQAPSGVIEKVFGVTINNYQVGEELDFSHDRDPMLPASLEGIVHTILGLNSIERVHRAGSTKPVASNAELPPGTMSGSVHCDGDPTKASANRAAAPMSGPTPSDTYPLREIGSTYAANPDNIQSSEGNDFNALQALSHCCNDPGDSGGSPTESSIALVGYGAFNVSDVETFFSYYGMAYNINWYCISNGGSGSTCLGVDGEALLDVEYSGAMSNSYGSYLDTAHIYEYEMGDTLYATYSDTFNQIVTDNHAKVVSTSYGWEENVGSPGSVATGTMHPIFNNIVGEGWTLIAASGDNGASAGCGDATAPLYPSTDPDFIAAGGTPTGSVTFLNGATNLGTGTLSGGVATLSTTALPAGFLTLQVSYAGAGNYLPTNSPPFDQTVTTPPSLTSPSASPVSGPTNFVWSPGTGWAQFELRIGTTGPGSLDIYNSGDLASSVTSETVNIPANGVTIYVRLYYRVTNGTWNYKDYTFTEQ